MPLPNAKIITNKHLLSAHGTPCVIICNFFSSTNLLANKDKKVLPCTKCNTATQNMQKLQ